MGASVKIMLSYDYCHFEVCKSTDQPVTDKEINEMRKDVQRLADEAVRQYKVAKARAYEKDQWEKDFEREIYYIRAKAETDRTPEEVAKLKLYEDNAWRSQFEDYDYYDNDEPDF